jgi:signal transduction histidine kinase
LFKVFFRLHPARDFEGLWLRLVQCRKMLALMGGSISLTGTLNAGCCVSVILPEVWGADQASGLPLAVM